MTPSSSIRRALPIAAVAFAATFAMLFAILSPLGASADERHHTHTSATTVSKHAFHDAMRELWEQHVAWTRLAITDFAAGSAGFNATASRLLQNQEDIGDAIKPFFGNKAGNALTSLLHDHITIAVQLLQAAKDGDTAAFDDAKTKWYKNANDVADFLSAANPKNWARADMRQMMKVHLDQTLAEASNELTGHYVKSVNKYDHIEHHMLMMADELSAGIVAKFPNKFR
jgi:hypothetical protein